MALPSKTALLELDTSWRGAPFVRVEAKSLSTAELDFSWRSAPFVAAPATSAALSLTADTVSFLLSGQSNNLLANRTSTGDTVAFSLTGSDINLNLGKTIPVDVGSFSVSGFDAGSIKHSVLTSDAGSFSLVGQSASFNNNYAMTGQTGSYTLSGVSAGILASRIVSADQTTYSYIGVDASTVAGYVVSSISQNYTLSGINANFSKASYLTASQGSFSVQGQQANLVRVTQNSISRDVQSLSPGALVEFFVLDLTILGGSVYRFHAGTNELYASVVWQGNTYSPMPIEASGFEVTGSGSLPRPSLKVANITGVLGALISSLDDLIGAKITRKRTMSKYLDAVNFTGGVNPSADPNQYYPDEVWFVNRKVSENKIFIEFELSSAMDVQGVRLPRRQVIQNTCAWIYRSSECSYAGGAVADILDQPTNSLALDACSKKLSGCKLRFGDYAELPYGAFVGAGLLS